MTGVLDSAVLVIALVRARAGWRRGFVAQALDVAGFAVAALLAWRFHCVLAAPWRAAGLSPGWAQVAGALSAFVPVIVAVAVTGWKLGRITRQPGLRMTDRLLGAGLAVLLTGVALAFLQSVVAASPLDGYAGIGGALGGGARGGSSTAALLGIAEPVVRRLDAVIGFVVPGGCRP